MRKLADATERTPQSGLWQTAGRFLQSVTYHLFVGVLLMDRPGIRLLAIGLLALLPAMAQGDGIFLDGLSPRSISRGGTNVAFSDNAAVLFDNPAGAVGIQGQSLVEFGTDIMLTDFGYSDPDNPSAAALELVPLPQMGFIRRSNDGRWAYGLGMYVPAGFKESYDLQGPFPLLGERRYDSFGSLAKILPGVAHRVTDRLSIGATLGVGISHVELEGPYFIQGPSPLRGLPTMLDLQGTGATLVWSAGLQYALTDATTIGLAYQSESRFELNGSTRVDVPLLGEAAYDSQLDMTWPRSVAAGVRHAFCPHRIISCDLVWFDWSAAFDNLGLHLDNPTTPGFPPLYEQFPLRWRDTLSLRLGYERYFDSGRVLRFGYVHHRNPIPDATLTPFIQGTLEHAFSIGYGCKLGDWNLDAGYMFSFGADQVVGTSEIVGGDFDNSVNKAQTHCIAIGLIRQF